MGILTVDLHLPDGGSLKGKRKELLRVRNTLTRRLSCSVAEVDHHELWQRTRLTLCLADRTAGGAAERIEQGRRLLHADELFQVVGEAHEVLPVDGEPDYGMGDHGPA